jgi:CRP-like cAMP-binding protein
MVIIPNSRLATSSVINHSFPAPESRFQVRLRLDIEVPVERALRILSSAVQAACRTGQGPCLRPAPDVLVTDASGEGVEYVVRFWLDPARVSSDTATHQVWACIIEQLTKAGLTFARPQENIFVARLPRVASGYKSVEDRLAFLRKVAIFQGFPDTSLRVLAAEIQVNSARPGQGLVREGDPGESMFVLAEGMLRVLAKTTGSIQPIELATLKPGEVFGERSLLTGEPRSASVVAMTECVVLEITREALQHLLDREPDLLILMEETVSQRDQANLRLADGLVSGFAAETPASRTQAFILRMRQLFRPVR